METILENEMSLERLQALFLSKQLTVEIIEVAPEVPKLSLKRDAYLKINYSDNPSVIIWIDNLNQGQLRFRTEILSRKQTKKIEDKDLLDWVAENNQQVGCFGTVDIRNLLGITLEHRLPYQEGILDQTVLSVIKNFSQGASKAKFSLEMLLDFL